MAGQVPRGSRGRGRPSRHGSSWAVPAAPSAVAPGPGSTRPRPTPAPSPAASPAPRRTYRSLISRGLTPDEAATLTAYLAGIPIDEAHWSLRQVNELLFLRELQRTGRFGRTDGRTNRTH
jgi:hypothetical protein